MKIGFRKLTTLIALGGISIGLVGSGLHAQFTDSAVVSQAISVGQMHIQVLGYKTDHSSYVAATGPNAAEVTCAAVPVTTSTGDARDTCLFTVQSVGSIPIKGIKVSAHYSLVADPAVNSASRAAPFQQEWAKYTQNLFIGTSAATGTFAGYWSPLQNDTTIYSNASISGPVTFDPYIAWSDLSNASEDSILTVTYTITINA